MSVTQELDKLHITVTKILESWRRKLATEISEEPFRSLATELYKVSDVLEGYLSSEESKGLLKSARQDLTRMNTALNKVAEHLRILANSLHTYRPPESGGRQEDFRDQDAMNDRLDLIKISLQQIVEMAEQNKRVVDRLAGGGSGPTKAPQRQPDYYWPESRASGSDHFW